MYETSGRYIVNNLGQLDILWLILVNYMINRLVDLEHYYWIIRQKIMFYIIIKSSVKSEL